MRVDVRFVVALMPVLWAALLFGVVRVEAADAVRGFEDPLQQQRYERLLTEYRCLKCQNQNLADSPAGLAEDLRDEIYQQVRRDADDSVIDAYLVDRYGEFVRYRPRLSRLTWLLWFGPFILLLVAMYGAARFGQGTRQRIAAAEPLDSAEVERARMALKPPDS